MKPSLVILFLLCLGICSCVTYHAGMRDQEHFPGIERVTIVNQTRDGELSEKLKRSIYEQIRTRPGLSRKSGDDGVNLTLTLLSQETRNIARAEMRDKVARDDDDKAYQTVLSRVTIDVKYTVSNPDGTELLSGKVRGQGDLPWMNDQNIAYQNACANAVVDAARQVAGILSDAVWETPRP